MARRANTTKVFKCFLKDRMEFSFLLYIKIRNIKIDKSASIIINVYEKVRKNNTFDNEKRDTIILRPPFSNFIEIKGLKQNQDHSLVIFLENGKEIFN